MSIDYANLSTVAQTLITDNGRAITLVQFDSTLSDSAKPWNGPADARTAPDATLAVDGVFVEPSSATRLGMSTEVSDLLKRSTQIILISTTTDISDYNEVIDTDSSRWKITGMEQLKPGDTSLLYFVGVKR